MTPGLPTTYLACFYPCKPPGRILSRSTCGVSLAGKTRTHDLRSALVAFPFPMNSPYGRGVILCLGENIRIDFRRRHVNVPVRKSVYRRSGIHGVSRYKRSKEYRKFSRGVAGLKSALPSSCFALQSSASVGGAIVRSGRGKSLVLGGLVVSASNI